ncbi:MAG: hypothetical protein K6T28_10215 [Acidothermus sp.]|nr:hypothetical protein [Acidothermus sp.]
MLFGRLDLDRRGRRWLKHAGRSIFVARLISPWGRDWVDAETPLGAYAARRAAWGRQRAAAAAGRPHHDADLLGGGLDAVAAVLTERPSLAVDDAVELAVGDAATVTLRGALDEVEPPHPEPLSVQPSAPRAPALPRLASVR